jgi:hypothetical protein
MLELSRTTRKDFGKETSWIAATERQRKKNYETLERSATCVIGR